MANDYEYIGNELALFAQAEVWKSYFRSRLQRFLTGDVLEVGAGLGGTTNVFTQCDFRSWTCLEPDKSLADQLRESAVQFPRPVRYRFVHGTLDALGDTARFDSIIYIDVLEHIERDAEEVAKAEQHLTPGGHLVILSPAYQFLFSPFDAKIGHYRRYTLGALKRLTPTNSVVKEGFYLDSVGAAASLANRLLLKSSMPSLKQIRFWDRVLVRLSRLLDPIHFYAFGRSVVIVWSKVR